MIPPKGDENEFFFRVESIDSFRFDNDSPERGREYVAIARLMSPMVVIW